MSVLFYPRNIGIELARFFQMSSNDKKCCCSYMPLATLKRVVSDMERWPTIETIFLLGLADRLLRPDYPEVLKILLASSIAREARVIQYEDASLLDGAKAEGILDVPVIDEIVFSLDGSKDHENCTATFEEEHQKAVQNLSSFDRARNLKKRDLVVSLRVIDSSEKNLQKHSNSKEHIDSFLSVASLNMHQSKEICINKKNTCFSNKNSKKLPYSSFRIENTLVHTIMLDRNRSYDSENQLGNEPSYEVKGGCVFIEEDFLFISVDGFAKPCCASIDNEFNVGSIHNSDLGDLLNSDSMNAIRHSLSLDQREDLKHCRESLMSNNMAELASLEALWKKRDEQFLVDDQAEREYIFGHLLNVKHKVKRVDLGCGPVKLPGFIGVDRYPLPGVDVVADINSRLPFEDNSVDLVYASHSLEHVSDLLFTMAEIYRICKDGAQVCIVAPYYMQGLNLANPYHVQVFNEHTPRFWTNEKFSPIAPEIFSHPHAPMWGLAWSDHSEQNMDLRCMKMDFFYFPEYRAYPQELVFKKMKTHIDVCDQIMYNLIVVKNECMNHEDIQEDKMEYFEPPYITIRKLREELARVQEAKGALQGELARVQE
ncbi:MAG: methyltransferase domain-containing protein, partial [Parachlamydia sp.]|nr:methyltransferase domain-containing protein [Parachlamydia sp.]